MEIDVNDTNFEQEVIEKSKQMPVVVDFWADWCAPCRMLIPILQKIANDYGDAFLLAKANIDNAETSAGKYAVMSIPTIKLFKNGEVVDEFNGARPEPFIKKWLEHNGIMP